MRARARTHSFFWFCFVCWWPTLRIFVCVWYIYMIWQFLFSQPFFFCDRRRCQCRWRYRRCYYYYCCCWSCRLLSLCHFAEFSYIKPHRLRIFPVNVWMWVCVSICVNCVQELKTNGLKWIVATRNSHAMRDNEEFFFFLVQFCHIRWMCVTDMWCCGFFSSSIITTHQNVLDIHWLLSKIAHTYRFFVPSQHNR